jgi:hypothetical protein
MRTASASAFGGTEALDDRLLERVLGRCEIGDCWEWMGALHNGYGAINKQYYGHYFVHRFVWSRLVGLLPVGIVLDHLCRNRRCCNPDHLEPVSIKENVLRGVPGALTCRKGHNDWYTRPNGHRVCNECRRDRYRKKNGVTVVKGRYKEGFVKT